MDINRQKFFICIALLCTLFLVTGCAGDKNYTTISTASSTTQAPTETEPASMGHLRLSVSFDEDADYVKFTYDELGGNFNDGLSYDYDIMGVTIEINGQSMPLEDALRDGFITEEEIFCNARLDAREGFCEETYESLNGLTNFTFAYPDYNLRLLYDIYESPNGEQRLISEMVIYEKNVILLPCHLFVDEETGDIYDREDWGLNFEITEVSPTGMTIRCTHSGGQQIGQLEIVDYLKADDVTEFTFDWSEPYGQVSSGEYELVLWIKDIYDESQKHPLMRNFYDTQIYTVRFTVS